MRTALLRSGQPRVHDVKRKLIEDIRCFFESTFPVSEFDAWWARYADAVRVELGRYAYLAITKRGFSALRQVLEAEGMPFASSEEHCPTCGEKLFVVMPGKTTREEITAFARDAAWKDAVESDWLHAGRYCKNGCVVTLWNIR